MRCFGRGLEEGLAGDLAGQGVDGDQAGLPALAFAAQVRERGSYSASRPSM